MKHWDSYNGRWCECADQSVHRADGCGQPTSDGHGWSGPCAAEWLCPTCTARLEATRMIQLESPFGFLPNTEHLPGDDCPHCVQQAAIGRDVARRAMARP
jgi:hypothetical protein